MNNISKVRTKARVTQAQLGGALGWSQARISNYESGTRTPGLADCRRIVAALNELGANCTLDDVFPPEQEQGAAAA